MKRIRLTEKQRRAIIVQAGVEVALDIGLVNVTYNNVAEKCSAQTSVGTIRAYFKTKASLWRSITKHSDELRAQAQVLGVVK